PAVPGHEAVAARLSTRPQRQADYGMVLGDKGPPPRPRAGGVRRRVAGPAEAQRADPEVPAQACDRTLAPPGGARSLQAGLREPFPTLAAHGAAGVRARPVSARERTQSWA